MRALTIGSWEMRSFLATGSLALVAWLALTSCTLAADLFPFPFRSKRPEAPESVRSTPTTVYAESASDEVWIGGDRASSVTFPSAPGAKDANGWVSIADSAPPETVEYPAENGTSSLSRMLKPKLPKFPKSLSFKPPPLKFPTLKLPTVVEEPGIAEEMEGISDMGAEGPAESKGWFKLPNLNLPKFAQAKDEPPDSRQPMIEPVSPKPRFVLPGINGLRKVLGMQPADERLPSPKWQAPDSSQYAVQEVAPLPPIRTTPLLREPFYADFTANQPRETTAVGYQEAAGYQVVESYQEAESQPVERTRLPQGNDPALAQQPVIAYRATGHPYDHPQSVDPEKRILQAEVKTEEETWQPEEEAADPMTRKEHGDGWLFRTASTQPKGGGDSVFLPVDGEDGE